jgi:hypothetical protein
MKFEKRFTELINYQFLQGNYEELEDFVIIAA